MDEGNSRRQTFPTTQWSLIERAAKDDPEERQRALEEICRLYWPPVYAFIRSSGHSPHDAEDHTQALFAEMLRGDAFSKVDAAKGRLRSFLLTSVKNLLANDHSHRIRKKRGGGLPTVSLDTRHAEERCLIQEPSDPFSPDRAFEKQWAITVMEQVVTHLFQRYEKKGQSALFQRLKPFINSSVSLPRQTDLANEMGMSEQALRVTIHRLRKRYAQELRHIVKSTLSEGESVESELAHLMGSFS